MNTNTITDTGHEGIGTSRGIKRTYNPAVGTWTPLPIRPWRGIFVDGPHSTVNRDGDEIPEWTVCIGNEDAEPIGKVYFCSSHGSARALAARMAKDRRLEIVDESMAA